MKPDSEATSRSNYPSRYLGKQAVCIRPKLVVEMKLKTACTVPTNASDNKLSSWAIHMQQLATSDLRA